MKVSQKIEVAMARQVLKDKRKVLSERMTQFQESEPFFCVLCCPIDPSSASTTMTRRASSISTSDQSEPKLYRNLRELREHLFKGHWESQILVFEEEKNISARNSNVCPKFDCKRKFNMHTRMRSHFFELHKSLYEDAIGKTVETSLPNDSEWSDFVDRFCFKCFFYGKSQRLVLLHEYIEHSEFMTDFIKSNNLLPSGCGKSPPKELTDEELKSNRRNIHEETVLFKTSQKQSKDLKGNKSKTKKSCITQKAENLFGTVCSVKVEVTNNQTDPLSDSTKSLDDKSSDDVITSLDGLEDDNKSVSLTNGGNQYMQNFSPSEALSSPSPEGEIFVEIDPGRPNVQNECKICCAPFWKASDNMEKRKLNVARHLARTHFGVHVKMSFVLNQIERGLKEIQFNECLKCEIKFKGYAVASDHFASKHWSLEKFYNEFLTFKKLAKHPFEDLCENTHDFDNITLEDCFSTAKVNRPETQVRLYQLLSDGQVIAQPGPCFLISKEIPRCHECEKNTSLGLTKDENFCCQFAGIRKLKACLDSEPKSPYLFSFIPDGFLDPDTSPSDNDYEIWKFVDTFLHPDLNKETAEFIIKLTFPQFCKLIKSELDAKKNYSGKTIWRKLQEKAREMCDVCKTTIFNYHWTCGECGFFACLDCYNTRSGATQLQHRSDFSESEEPPAKRFRSLRDLESNLDDEFWPFCREGQRHEPQVMMLTQIIPGQWLEEMWRSSHDVIEKLDANIGCDCFSLGDILVEEANGIERVLDIRDPHFQNDDGFKYLDLMDEMLSCNVCHDVISLKNFDDHRLCHFSKPSIDEVVFEKSEAKFQEGVNLFSEKFESILGHHTAAISEVPESQSFSEVKKKDLTHDNCRLPKQNTISATIDLFPGVPHSWLCEGRLLHLHNPTLPKNIELFHSQWLRGQPVLVSNSSKRLDMKLWHPRAFLNDFGHLHHDLINCLSGKLVPQASLKKFWEGFEDTKHRFKDFRGAPMLLKLKDWPPSEDIAEFMPKRFKNLFDSFPLPEYTKREGLLNLAAFLPSYCLKPELGPKLYIAYGSAQHSDKASTNLHLDMSDAVNCLVYVSSPQDMDPKKEAEGVLREIEESGCDILMRERCVKELPGALWHIYHPSDTVKIRDFLNKIALSKNKRLDPHDDPIHDQSTYLDSTLRRQLLKDYGVRGYAIVQCAGDTVFIPAGACHQVRNLHSCIKVAEDFVSPENIRHCLHLTQEFRHLTEMHTNHEDKLQMKSILYHAVKSAITVLSKKD